MSASLGGEGPIERAHALWVRLRGHVEKAEALPAGDSNRGWLDRAIDADGRALFTMLSSPEFEPYAVPRGIIRARLLFVMKPPVEADRREAVAAVDSGFQEILKRHAATRTPG